MARREADVKRKSRPDILYSLSSSFTMKAKVELYLLDRNVISVIKSVNAGHSPDREDQISMIEELRSLDQAGNFFSPMTSITEGNIRSTMSKEQFRAVITDEAAELKKFFRYAETDSDFLINNIDTLCALPNGLNEHYFADYVAFLDAISPAILQTVAPKRRAVIRDKIVDEAIKRRIIPTHPVVMCCLSILYGCEASRGVLKPKKQVKIGEWHNAISDILVVSRLAQYMALASNRKFSFMTLDKSLRKFVDFFTIDAARTSGGEHSSQLVTTAAACSVRYSMFPDLSEPEIQDLGEILNRSSKSFLLNAKNP